jgi:integrase/recombinase XerD
VKHRSQKINSNCRATSSTAEAWQEVPSMSHEKGLKRFFKITCPRDWKRTETRPHQGRAEVACRHLHRRSAHAPQVDRETFDAVLLHRGLFLRTTLARGAASKSVHVHRGKGDKDRLVPLPQSTLADLRRYWATHRNPTWLFPAEGRNHKLAPTADHPMSEKC